MSNLYKSYHLVDQKDRIIDYNDVIKTKLEIILNSQDESVSSDAGFSAGLSADVIEGIPIGTPTDAADSEEILEKARQEAQAILDSARQEAEKIKADAVKEGREAAEKEAKAELAQKESAMRSEFETMQAQLKQEYDDLKSGMESELVHVITDVFKKVFPVVSDIDENLILNLVNNVMHNSEVGKEFTIRTSPEDYSFLLKNQGKIYCSTSKDVSFEILEDTGLKKSQCIIESDLGVYDCSLDIQLENIIKQLKLLSCIE